MTTSRLDTLIPDYAYQVPITNGQLWIGPYIPLYGASGFSAHVITQGGASGTLYSNSTNFQNSIFLSNQNVGMGLPTQGASVAAGVNSSNASITLTAQSPGLYLAGIYLSFTPTASGLLTIAVNVRRPSS